MLARARRDGWEGIIAKRTDSTYDPGVRSRQWLKLKVEHRQEFVVGGWTEPRNTREHIGALLLGYFKGDRLQYVGHTGGGFTRAGLRDMHGRLSRLERKTSPFIAPPRTNERAHWARPEVVVEVKFSEWTADGKLRQPIFLGVRDDKDARDVGREAESVQKKDGAQVRSRRVTVGAAVKRTSSRRKSKAGSSTKQARETKSAKAAPDSDVVQQLDALEESGSDGSIEFGGGESLSVSSLGKVFFPREKLTKGDVMRYYARVAGAILPALEDRPLVLKRYPNGIDGQSFYQQNAPPRVPAGVRVDTIHNEEGVKQRRFIGGNLITLLYTVQLGAISVDPWHARVPRLAFPDYTILDLDPGPKATFADVVEVARHIQELLDEYKLSAVAKTSGSAGMHIVVPLQTGSSEETALLAAQLIATQVVARAPSIATVERAVKARPAGTVYVDYLQNIRGKTVAGVYAVRARPGATVSTPIAWSELDGDLDPRDFTIESVPPRLKQKGDIWAKGMKRQNSLDTLIDVRPRTPKTSR
jgi:bifunctional non-homologous end joining protein LigD